MGGEMPVVGPLKLPFDQMQFLWLSSEFADQDLAAVNSSIEFFKEKPIQTSSKREKLLKGYHIRLVGDSQVWVDHIFGHQPKNSKKPGSADPGGKPEKPDAGSDMKLVNTGRVKAAMGDRSGARKCQEIMDAFLGFQKMDVDTNLSDLSMQTDKR
ncbi:hypothetical protein B0T10DRAFT_260595 [Thelonectria olida]|uniref:Uncharacterized protein n=1 Tax=Thelonectria olida TaxID=1576542 RepID=A0A9P8VRI1_9HYPO|nr:hypothetical protein B0T10DRAFT_260595 [Thelonectria olida]